MNLMLKEVPLQFTDRPKIQEDLVDQFIRMERKLDIDHIPIVEQLPYEDHESANAVTALDAPITQQDRLELCAYAGFIYYTDENDTVVAYLRYNIYEPVYYLGSLYVEPEYRHQHLGAGLIDRLYEVAKKNRISKINLGCMGTNTSASKFYFKQGFKISDTSYCLLPLRPPRYKDTFNIIEVEWIEDRFHRIFKELWDYLDKNVTSIKELENIQKTYLGMRKKNEMKIFLIDGYEYAMMLNPKSKALYWLGSTIQPKDITPSYLDEIAESLLNYQREHNLKMVFSVDFHLPIDLGSSTKHWYEAGYTFYRRVQ